MKHPVHITSPQNERIKHFVELREKSSARRKQGMFVVEGERELRRALHNDFSVHSIFVCEGRGEKLYEEFAAFHDFAKLEHYQTVATPVFAKLAMRENSAGVAAIFRSPDAGDIDGFAQKTRGKNVLIVESVEKPGNIGAIFRTADASGIGGIMVLDSVADVMNPNSIRASIGAVFSVPFCTVNREQLIEFSRTQNRRVVVATPHTDHDYFSFGFRGEDMVLLGSEAHGVQDIWSGLGVALVKIPMLGQVDSLNVSVSAALLCYELLRLKTKA